MKQTAVEWLMDEAMKIVVQYIQGTLNQDTLDDVIYELGTKAKAMEKEQMELAHIDGGKNQRTAVKYYNETFKPE